eukprot:4287168-Amphidinium_carterae.1
MGVMWHLLFDLAPTLGQENEIDEVEWVGILAAVPQLSPRADVRGEPLEQATLLARRKYH